MFRSNKQAKLKPALITEGRFFLSVVFLSQSESMRRSDAFTGKRLKTQFFIKNHRFLKT